VVAEQTIVTEPLSAVELIARIESLKSGPGGVLAFDGDGTLWSGDVGEDVFEAALEQSLIREAALPSLQETAACHDLAASGSPTAIAARIYRAYREGRFPEDVVCEVMTWCYAGWKLDELAEFVSETLRRKRLNRRLNRKLEPILQYAKSARLRCVIISASPRVIVERAASHWCFATCDIAAAQAQVHDGVVLPALAVAVPYGPSKKSSGRALFGDAEWLASFGDSAFDIDMLLAAKLGVAVTPKPALRQALPSLPSVVLFA
jgi:phosphoserine phosphatase